MKAFVDTKTLTILTTSEVAARLGGGWGELQDSGKAVWIDVPPGELLEDCDVTAGPPVSLAVNAARKAARTASETARAARRARLSAAVPATLADITPALVKDLIDHLLGR